MKKIVLSLATILSLLSATRLFSDHSPALEDDAPPSTYDSPALSSTSEENPADTDAFEFFPSKSGKLLPLQGRIIEGRYLSPNGTFSCKAEDYNSGQYIAQDGLMEGAEAVGFYGTMGRFQKAEIIFIPEIKNKTMEKKDLEKMFESFGIGILEEVDHAEGIEILKKEMIGDKMLFAALSIKKMSIAKDADDNHLSSTRSYLVYQEHEKIVLLSNQILTPHGIPHTPKSYVKPLREDILAFQKTFDFVPKRISF